jgi:hypothetical protein
LKLTSETGINKRGNDLKASGDPNVGIGMRPSEVGDSQPAVGNERSGRWWHCNDENAKAVI